MGPYEIEAVIGVGGMGEVFRARDKRLDRAVAIKVLPRAFASHLDSRRRLEREAKTISRLNHPHICTLHDVGHHEGVDYLVMELIDGQSLADRLARGALPLDQVLRYGSEIASALGQAHRAGIVHRDLKPGNIMIAKSGAKLLDFGLAKGAVEPDGIGAPLSETQQKPLTEEGVVVGTFQYMAPEQIDGLPADARTDIFALGAVLYEMATGRRAFAGASRSSVIAAILAREPEPLSEVEPLTPPALEHVIRKCLAKEPDDRWQSALDIAAELDWIRTGSQTLAPGAPSIPRRQFLWAAGGVVAGIAGAEAFRFIRTGRTPRSPRFTSIAPPSGTELAIEYGAPQISPDGQTVAFVVRDGSGNSKLWVRSLSSRDAKPLEGTAQAREPFWSPDGRQLGFFTPSDDGRLKRIDLDSSTVTDLAYAPFTNGGSWSERGDIIFSSVDAPLRVVSSSGGPVRDVTKRGQGEIERAHSWPSFLPDGRHFVYHAVAYGETPRAVIRLGSIDGSVSRELMETESAARYVPPGFLFYRRERTLVAQGFDVDRMVMRSDRFKFADDVTDDGKAVIASASSQSLLYHAGLIVGQTELVWFDRSGRELGRLPAAGRYRRPSISHDGRSVAVEIPDTTSHGSAIWVLDLVRGTRRRLTDNAYAALVPAWSPDDQQLCFMHGQLSAGDIAIKPVDGTKPEQLLEVNPAFTIPTDWSPDGRHLVLHERRDKERALFDLYLFSIADRKRSLFAQRATQGRFSPDGKWLVYLSSAESERSEVFVQSLDPNARRWQVSTEGGSRPRWSRDGKEVYFTRGTALMSASVSMRAENIEVGMPRVVLPATAGMFSSPQPQYDLAPDGRILVVVEQKQTIRPLTLVENWTSLVS